MFNEPLALLSLFATLGLLVVSWRAANAAKLNADVAAREFRLLRRPLVDVKWTVRPSESDENTVLLFARVTEATGVPTMLHSLEISVNNTLLPYLSEKGVKEEPATMLKGDVATYVTRREFNAPPPVLLGLAAAGPDARHLVVGTLVVKAVISLADDETDKETWQAVAVLNYDVEQTRIVEPVTVSRHLPSLSRRPGGRRSRVLDPVSRAWERWWDSVS